MSSPSAKSTAKATAVEAVEYRPVDSRAPQNAETDFGEQWDRGHWDMADNALDMAKEAAENRKTSKRNARTTSPAAAATGTRSSSRSGNNRKAQGRKRRSIKRSFYAIRQCDGLNAPAIFLNKNDIDFYIDQDESEDHVEYRICDNILDAMEYIDQAPKGSLLTEMLRLHNMKTPPPSAATTASASSTSRKRSAASESATASEPDDRRSPRKKQKQNETSSTDPGKGNRRVKNWEDKFEQLCQFHERYGHVNVPKKLPENDDTDPEEHLKLHRWVQYIRAEWDKYHENPKSVQCLDPSRVSRLQALGLQGTKRYRRRTEKDNSSVNNGGDGAENDDNDDNTSNDGVVGGGGTGCVEDDPQGRESTSAAASNDQQQVEEKLSARELQWEERFAALEKHKQEHGTFDVDPKRDLGLRRWVRYVCEKKRLYDVDPIKASPCLTEPRVQRLLDLGFDFTFKPIEPDRRRQETLEDMADWDHHFELLKKYQEEHGHTNVRHADESTFPLRKWILRQRAQYERLRQGKSSTLTKERMDLLTSIGLSLTPSKKRLSFDERAIQWLEYRQKHGKDPSREGEDSLGIWVGKTRSKYAKLQAGEKTNLTQEQADRLTSWGFKWDSGVKRPAKKTKALSWDERFQQLVQYKAENGHTIVPQLNGALGMWVHRQRRDYKKMIAGRRNYMTPEKIAKLESIGFVFHAKQCGARGMLKDQQERARLPNASLGNTTARKLRKVQLPTRSALAARRQQQLLHVESDGDEDDSQRDDDNGSMTSEEADDYHQYGQPQPVAAAAAIANNNDIHIMQFNSLHNQQNQHYRNQLQQQQHHHPMFFPG